MEPLSQSPLESSGDRRLIAPSHEQPVALVTGSGSARVGAIVADALAEAGYRLAIHYRRSEAPAQAAVRKYADRGIEAVAVQADVAREADVARMFDEIDARFGRIDVLVACAAIWKSIPLAETRAADVQAHFETNLLGTFLCCQQAGLRMVAQERGGCLITIGDWATARPYRDHAAYFVSKGAIPTLTRTFAVELGLQNPRVRANCILPGPVMLPADLPDAEKEAAIAGTLVQREGDPQHIARAVLYLVENDFVTGDTLRVDGGRTIFARDA